MKNRSIMITLSV